MGYAQVAGLPPVYGLYGSVFPILIFGLLSTSPQFIFGVDAAPAALVGAFLAEKGITYGSDEAVSAVPLITMCVSIWLMVFFFLKAGRLVNYISTPVMGGFISGISTTVIFMQIPKLIGGQSGTGEIVELVSHIAATCRRSFNTASLLFGAVSLLVLIVSKKLIPKFPVSLLVMTAGAVLGYCGTADKYGIAKLSEVDPGLPAWSIPEADRGMLSDIIPLSMTIAIVIMAETLLASNNLAQKNGHRLNENREILVYSLGNLAAGVTGCCPVNGSVSRSSMAEQCGGASQVMSLTASAVMAVILMFFTGAIKFLPVPVLTAIVISALLGAVEFHLAKRLFRQDKRELFIFLGAFAGVLFFGTVYGVLIGMVLSFADVIINTANPKRSFLGVIPGHEGFHSLERNCYSVPLKKAVLYRFSGNLYFANIRLFISDIEGAVKDDTSCVIVDSGAVCNIDITAAERISSLDRSLKNRGIRLYFASHIGQLNDRFRQLGIGWLVEEGRCRRTIPSALYAAGFRTPYELESVQNEAKTMPYGNADRLEFEWAFGDKADEEMKKLTEKLLSDIDVSGQPRQELSDVIAANSSWRGIDELDNEDLLVHLQLHLNEIAEKLGMPETQVGDAIERRKLRIARHIALRDASALDHLREHFREYENALKEKEPSLYNELMEHRRQAVERLRKSEPELAETIEKLYGNTGI